MKYVLYNTEMHKYMGDVFNPENLPPHPLVDLKHANLYNNLKDAKFDLENCYSAFPSVPDSWKLVLHEVASVLDI